jgi:tripartite-type tricarboxylate transporter receptor subunit TctC
VLVRFTLLAAAIVSLPLVADPLPAQAQDYYKGKTITLYAGMPPGGGIDSEMRMVAHSFGRFIPLFPGTCRVPAA